MPATHASRPINCLGTWVSSVLLPVILAGCVFTSPQSRPLVDLTHPFNVSTIYWPGQESFHWEETHWGPNKEGLWYASAVYSASEHGGTHLDAPIHFSESGWSVDEIPVEHLMGEAIVVDIRAQVDSNPDYTLQVKDILQWERRHGAIPPDVFVMLFTGFARHWPDKERYLGSSTPDDPTSLHFPGFSAEAVTYLLDNHRIRGIGIDTASIDPGQSRHFPVHRILGEANRYALENVAHLEHLPARGAQILALPMKIQGGTGGPVRIIAILPNR